MNDATFLRDLADRLRHVPVAYGVDQSDVDRLVAVARRIDRAVEAAEEAERIRNARLDDNLGDD